MSAFAFVNGTAIVWAHIVIPFAGIWHVDAVLDRVAPTVGPQVVQVAGLVMTGTVVGTADYAGQTRMRIVGGQGGWSTTLPAKQYASIPQSIVLLDAAVSVLEAIVPPVPDTILTSFIRRQAAAASILNQLIGPESWWMDIFGIVQAFPHPPVPIVSAFAAVDVKGEQRVYEIETDTIADWLPGSIFVNTTNVLTPKSVGRVNHRLSAGKLHTEVIVQ